MYKDLFSLKGRVALVTGGSRGIGKMIAGGFLSQGAAKVYITARKAAPCEATAKELRGRIWRRVHRAADRHLDHGRHRHARSRNQEARTELDILVNNAGAAWGADFDEFPESGWDKVMNLNVKAPFFLPRRWRRPCARPHQRGTAGQRIYIASIDGIFVNPMETYSYAASKSGLIHLTRRMAVRLIKRPHRGHRDRAGAVQVGYEQGRARPRR